MKCNIGLKNRVWRFVAGLLIVLISLIYIFNYSGNIALGAVVALIGVISLLEGVFGYCLLHGLRGTQDMR